MNLIKLANVRIKPLGRSSIEVIDSIWMNVHVGGSGCVELRVRRGNYEDAVMIRERLKSAGYDAGFRELKDGFEVYISQDEIKKHPTLIVKVCEVLRRMIEEAMSEGKTKKAQKTTKAMKNLR